MTKETASCGNNARLNYYVALVKDSGVDCGASISLRVVFGLSKYEGVEGFYYLTAEKFRENQCISS